MVLSLYLLLCFRYNPLKFLFCFDDLFADCQQPHCIDRLNCLILPKVVVHFNSNIRLNFIDSLKIENRGGSFASRQRASLNKSR